MTKLRICTEADRPLLHELRNHVEVWLAERGYEEHCGDHWSYRAHAAIDRLMDEDRFIGLDVGGTLTVVGALAGPDMDFWTTDDDLNSAWYIARVMTAQHGGGHGRTFIDLVAAAAAVDNRRYLRLDCMRDNTGLHRYYQNLGFQLVRIQQHPARESGALFQRKLPSMPPPWDSGMAPQRPKVGDLGNGGSS